MLFPKTNFDSRCNLDGSAIQKQEFVIVDALTAILVECSEESIDLSYSSLGLDTHTSTPTQRAAKEGVAGRGWSEWRICIGEVKIHGSVLDVLGMQGNGEGAARMWENTTFLRKGDRVACCAVLCCAVQSVLSCVCRVYVWGAPYGSLTFSTAAAALQPCNSSAALIASIFVMVPTVYVQTHSQPASEREGTREKPNTPQVFLHKCAETGMS